MVIMMAADFFLQKLAINGEDVGTNSVLELTYIERLNLTCPKLILKLTDRYKVFQDNAALADGSVLTLTLGDASGRGEEMFSESFVVGANWEDDGKLVIEAMQADIYRIKQLAVTPKFYTNKTPLEILRDVFPELEIVADEYNERHTYHVNTGYTVAMMLERLKWDAGAVIYLSRGKLYFKLISRLMDSDTAFQFDYKRNVSSNPTIINYQRYNPKATVLRREARDYRCWSRTDGMISLSNGKPRAFLSTSKKSHLANHNLAVIPVMDCTLAGDGRFMPSQLVKFELNRDIPDSVLDESVPDTQVMIGVRHFQQGMKYLSVCEFGEVVDANK